MPAIGEFRTILEQIKGVKEKLQVIDPLTESVNVINGNVSLLGDEIIQKLKEMEETLNKKLQEVVKPTYEKIKELEIKVDQLIADGGNVPVANSQDSGCSPTTSKRRKTPRNPDLSVSCFSSRKYFCCRSELLLQI